MSRTGRSSLVTPRVRSKAFSLIELLCVIAIIALLAALTTLGVNSLGQANKLTMAGNLTVDLINRARQTAKSQNTLTLIAMIKDGSDAGRALATFAYAATNGTSGTWSQLDRWSTLPEGVVIDQTLSANFFQSMSSATIPHLTTFTRSGQSVTCSSAIFLPDGRVFNTSSAPQVLYLQLATSTSSTGNYYKIIFNQATGNPVIRRP